MNDQNPSSFYSMFYFGAKKYTRKHPRLLRFVRAIRFVGRLGPWRNLMMRYIKEHAPNRPLQTKQSTLFPTLDGDQTVDNLIRSGYSLGPNLPEEYADRIVDYYRDKEFTTYDNPHNDCELISNIVHDPKVVEVARRYLGIEPILYRTRIHWSLPKHDDKNIQSLNSKKKDFHYDVGDFKSLNLFIYLTDVDIDCGPHVVIQQTRNKTLKQLLNPFIGYEVATRRYGERIKVITGTRGTIIFEDLNSFHQHSIGKKPRLLLTILYLFHRKPE